MTLHIDERPDGTGTRADFPDIEKPYLESPNRAPFWKIAETPPAYGGETGQLPSVKVPAVTFIESPYRQPGHEPGERSEFPRIPPLEGLETHDPVLTSTVREMIQKLWAIVVSRALQTGFPVERTIVSVFRDPEENKARALLRLFVRANAAQSIAFWDSLEKDFQDWLRTVDEHRRATFLRNISLRVYWS
ncbi:MAG: hypothetical protein HY673_01115 [Chloroflexi bacterium]|nr:hypothetical protein [Chloroflexota bacterium]